MKSHKPHKLKKAFTALLITVFAPVSSFALEVGKPYVKVETGFSLLAKNPNKEEYSKKAKGTHLYGVGVGYKFTDHVRGEVSVLSSGNYRYHGSSADNETEKQSLKTSAVMINGYYDFKSYGSFTPYLTFGLGLALNKASDMDIGINEITVKGNIDKRNAWQAGSGVLYKITKTTSLDLSYKLFQPGTIATTNQFYDHKDQSIREHNKKLKGKLLTHNFLIGLIYNF